MKLVYNILFLTVLVFGIVLAEQNTQQQTLKDKITFLSQPPVIGQVGIAYTYTARAVSSDPAAKVYYFPYQTTTSSASPIYSFAVDSVTGLLTFLPKLKGWYILGVIARSTQGDVTAQIFYVTVSGGNGIVQGKVTDTLKAGIKDVIIELYKTDLISSVSVSGGGSFSFFTNTDASGNYRVSGIDPGKYKLRAAFVSRQYDSQWYDGKTNPIDAKVIDVKDSLVTLVNFVLRGGADVQPKGSVSGSVKDTLKGPMKNAEIIFADIDFALNSNNSLDDFRKYFDFNAGTTDCRLDGGSQYVIHRSVDTNGIFNTDISPGSYLVFAKADGYGTEFYQEQSGLLLATTIAVQQNKIVSNINFTLTPVPPNALGSISGTVLDTLRGMGVPSRIIISKDIWTTSATLKAPRIYVGDTDSLGVYTVGKLPPGSYYVLALPLGSYSPGYPSTDAENNHWKKARTIVVNGNSVSGITLYVHQLVLSASGYSGITGIVRSLSTPSTALQGAFVYATKNNQVAGYSISNATGAFSIDGLAPGSYSVTVDNLGFTEPSSLTAALSYTSTGSPLSATLAFYLSPITSVERIVSVPPEEFSLSQNYPNPFNPSTTITYAIQRSGMVILKLYNIVGQEIMTLVQEYQTAGNYQVTFNAENLSSGVYFYRLQAGAFTETRKLVLQR
jgi:hypothetical protein